jgi:hypothetical protein
MGCLQMRGTGAERLFVQAILRKSRLSVAAGGQLTTWTDSGMPLNFASRRQHIEIALRLRPITAGGRQADIAVGSNDEKSV